MKLKIEILVGILIGLTILSCSKDDTSDISNQQDPIIGVWKPTKVVDVYNNGTENTLNLSTCEQKTTVSFKQDGEFISIEFYIDNNLCTEDGNFINGSWEKISDSEYKIIQTYFDTDTQQNVTETNIPDEISFPNDNTLRVRYDEGIEENGITYEYYYTEFTKI